MQLIEKFHKMESENLLFDLGKEIDLPLWDIVRYNVFIKYCYSNADKGRFETIFKHTFYDYLKLVKMFFLFILKLPFQKGNDIIFTSSRYLNDDKKWFDKSAFSIINSLKENFIIMEPVLEKKLAYAYFYDFSSVLRRIQKKKNLISSVEFSKIENALNVHFGESLIEFDEINRVLLDFKSDFIFFKYLFKIKSTKRIFIATGNPKAHILAAKKLNIETYLLQHASIEYDQVDCSYPYIDINENKILFPEYILTYGDYWCKNMNVPAKKIIPIGNDFFYNKPKLELDNTILIISTIIHGDELKSLTKKIAFERKDLNFVYKLHPNEFQYFDMYADFFKQNLNVKIIAHEIDTNELIAKSILVVLIVSSVLYEALNQNKKIAIYQRINFERQLPLLKFKNVYLFDDEQELIRIFNKETIREEVNFFRPTNYNLIDEVLAEGVLNKVNIK